MNSGQWTKCVYNGKSCDKLKNGNIYAVMTHGANVYASVMIDGVERDVDHKHFSAIPEMFVAVKSFLEYDAANQMLLARGYVVIKDISAYHNLITGIWVKSDGTINATTYNYVDIAKFRCDTKMYEMKVDIQMLEVPTFQLPKLTGNVTKEQALAHIEQLKRIIGE